MPALPTDSRSEWDPGVLDDKRVLNLWDGERLVGTWLADQSSIEIESFGPFVWDAFLLLRPRRALGQRAGRTHRDRNSGDRRVGEAQLRGSAPALRVVASWDRVSHPRSVF
jgi:hypothetical protein